MQRRKILIVDDSAIFAQSAKEFLAADERLNVLQWASSGAEAIARVETERPDIVLMDLHMPVMNGLEATTQIKAKRFPPKVIVISLDDDAQNKSDAQLAGADAFLGKSEVGTQLPSLIERLSGLGVNSTSTEPTNEE